MDEDAIDRSTQKTPADPSLAAVGGTIRKLRKQHGLTLSQFALLTRQTSSALSLIETGQRDPKLSTLKALADALRVPVSELMLNVPSIYAPSQAHHKTNASVTGYDLEDDV